MNDLEPAKIERRIYSVRGVRVILDADLAALYGVSTKRLNEQFRRNRKRFPADFMFQLSAKEFESLRSQIVMSEKSSTDPDSSQFVTSSRSIQNAPRRLRSQFVISKIGRGGRRYLPYAFTEHGTLQAANGAP